MFGIYVLRDQKMPRVTTRGSRSVAKIIQRGLLGEGNELAAVPQGGDISGIFGPAFTLGPGPPLTPSPGFREQPNM